MKPLYIPIPLLLTASQIASHRVTDFSTSPLAFCQKAVRYRLALCRTEDLLVPAYESADDSDDEGGPRYERWMEGIDEEPLYERSYYIRSSLDIWGPRRKYGRSGTSGGSPKK